MATKVLLAVLLHQVLSEQGAGEVSKPTDTALPFLVLGDWGGQTDHPYTTPTQLELAKVMGKRAAEIGSQFILTTGDNFYDSGVKTVDDSRFKETFLR